MVIHAQHSDSVQSLDRAAVHIGQQENNIEANYMN
jgi:hypothetical protein